MIGSLVSTPRRHWRLLAGLAALIVVVAAVAVWSWWDAGSRATLDARIAELEARGEPMSRAAAGGELVPEDDGLALLLAAQVWLDDEGLDPRSFDAYDAYDVPPGLPVELAEDQRTALRTLVRDAAPYYRMLDAALERPSLRLHAVKGDTHLDDWLEGAVPAVQSAHRMLFLRWLAVPESRMGTGLSASTAVRLEILSTQHTLGNRIDARGGALIHLVGVVVECGALNQLRLHVESGELDWESSAEVRSALLTPRGFDRTAAAMRAERANMLAIVRIMIGDIPGDFGTAEPIPRLSEDGVIGIPLVRAWRRALLELVDDLQTILDARDLTWRERAELIAPIGRPRYQELSLRGDALTDLPRVILPSIHAPAARGDALRALALVSLRVRAHRDAHREWPVDLAAVERAAAVTLPLDPFTDRPFSFERVGDTVQIASPGPCDSAVWGAATVERNDPVEDGLVWTLRERAPPDPR